jgi:hypothetical protein
VRSTRYSDFRRKNHALRRFSGIGAVRNYYFTTQTNYAIDKKKTNAVLFIDTIEKKKSAIIAQLS